MLFIAGGVGITPFISMLRYLIDTGEKRDVILFYVASSEKDFAYHDVLEDASRAFGLHTIYVTGTRINRKMLEQYAYDVTERQCYISGPDAMVKTYKTLISDAGVPRRKIKTDYFTGFSSI